MIDRKSYQFEVKEVRAALQNFHHGRLGSLLNVALYYLEGRTGNDTRFSGKFQVKSDPKEKHSNLKKTIMSVDVVEKRNICN